MNYLIAALLAGCLALAPAARAQDRPIAEVLGKPVHAHLKFH